MRRSYRRSLVVRPSTSPRPSSLVMSTIWKANSRIFAAAFRRLPRAFSPGSSSEPSYQGPPSKGACMCKACSRSGVSAVPWPILASTTSGGHLPTSLSSLLPHSRWSVAAPRPPRPALAGSTSSTPCRIVPSSAQAVLWSLSATSTPLCIEPQQGL